MRRDESLRLPYLVAWAALLLGTTASVSANVADAIATMRRRYLAATLLSSLAFVACGEPADNEPSNWGTDDLSALIEAESATPMVDYKATCDFEHSERYDVYSVISFVLTVTNQDSATHGIEVVVMVIDPYALVGVDDIPAWSSRLAVHKVEPHTSVTERVPVDFATTYGEPACIVEDVIIQ